MNWMKIDPGHRIMRIGRIFLQAENGVPVKPEISNPRLVPRHLWVGFRVSMPKESRGYETGNLISPIGCSGLPLPQMRDRRDILFRFLLKEPLDV